MQLDGLLARRKSLTTGDIGQEGVQFLAGLFVDGSALVAYQYDGLMGGLRLRATDKGIEAFDAMNQAMSQEEIQRAVDGRGIDRVSFPGEPIDQVVRFGRLMIRPDFRQDGTTNRRQAGTARQTDGFSVRERGGGAFRVIFAGHDDNLPDGQ